MELIKTIIIYGYGLTNIFLYVYFLIYLFQKRNIYPYSKTAPYCSLFIITCLLLHQVGNLYLSWKVYLDDLLIEKIAKIIIGINIHYLIMIPIYYKFKFLIKSAKANFYFLSFGSMDKDNDKIASIKKEMNAYFEERLITPSLDLYYCLKAILVYLWLTVIVILFLIISRTKMIDLFVFSSNLFTETEYFANRLQYEIANNLTINSLFLYIRNLAFIGQLFLFVYYLSELWKYPNKNDFLYIRLEMALLLGWFSFHNIYHYICQFYDKMNFFYMFFLNYVIDFCFIIVEIFINSVRRPKQLIADNNNLLIPTKYKEKRKNNYYLYIHNYKYFMRNFYCFNFMKKTLEEKINKNNNLLNYLDFWVDYYLFKQNLKKKESLKKSDLIINAMYIYNNYFSQGSEKYIEIPENNYDILEKQSESGFCLTKGELDSIFELAFKDIDNKIFNYYCNLINKKKNIKLLTSIFMRTEFDQIKPDLNSNLNNEV